MYKYEYSVYVYYIDSHVTRTCNTHTPNTSAHENVSTIRVTFAVQ